VGRVEEGLNLLTQALTVAEQTGEKWNLAELYRRKGDLLLNSIGREAEAERCFQQALDIAIRQQAKALEVRAASRLGRR